jgi:SAM-dependent methyltransferase
VRRYLEEEVRGVCQRLGPRDTVLELGCGTGRVAWQLAPPAARVVGIDISLESLGLAALSGGDESRCSFVAADATALAFPAARFDAVVCVQNGICAFRVDPVTVLREALRVTTRPGRVLLSSYTEGFWPERLAWFRLQAAHGLVGEIDEEATRPGEIVCRDGFSVGTMSREGFLRLCETVGVTPAITEVDGSSLLCDVVV